VTETQIEPTPSTVAPGIVQHKESFEVVHADGRIEFVYHDENPGRRAITGRLSKQAAFVRAREILRGRNPGAKPGRNRKWHGWNPRPKPRIGRDVSSVRYANVLWAGTGPKVDIRDAKECAA
jgi:hypothetical protein